MERKNSTNSEQIIKNLYFICAPSFFNFLQKQFLQPRLLKAIEDIDESSLIFSFIPLLFVKNRQVSDVARQKVSELLKQLPVTRISSFDEKIRSFYYPNYYKLFEKYWYNLQPSIIDTLCCNPTTNLVAIKFLCSHPNGFIRLKAINALVKISVLDALPFLILRANDWVDEIRQFCHATMFDLIHNKKISLIIEFLPLVKQLKSKGRYIQIKLIQRIELALLTDCQNMLFKVLESYETIASRYAFELLASNKSLTEKLLAATINCKDIIIKLKAFNLAKQEYEPNQFFIFLSNLSNDRFMPIRKKALYEMIEHYPEQATVFLEKGLFDHSFSIRNLCRFYLQQRGIANLANYYINTLQNQEIRPNLLLGLSESGNKDDFEIIRPFIAKNNPRIQAAILIAAFKMEPYDWKNIISNLVNHPTSSILKAFATSLIAFPERYSFSELVAIIYRRDDYRTIHYFLKIISHISYDRWTILNFILNELILIENNENQILFEEYLVRWINNNSPNINFVRPSADVSVMTRDNVMKVIEKNPTSLIYKQLMENIKCFLNLP